MKQLIHDATFGLQYKYPCIAYIDEEPTGDEMIIISETKVEKVYPMTMRVIGMEFIGEDFWGRPTFYNEETRQYYCELDRVLYFKGNDSEGEPHYPVKEEIIFEAGEIDEDFAAFDAMLEKGKLFFEKDMPRLQLLGVDVSLQKATNEKESDKIICKYKLKVLPA